MKSTLIKLLFVFVTLVHCETYASTSPCRNYEHGCCPDGKTQRFGSRNEGCGLILCIDERPTLCEKKKNNGGLKCGFGNDHYEVCASSCGSPCRPRESPYKKCVEEGHVNCCWDGSYGVHNPCLACPMMERTYADPCRRFKTTNGGCNSGSYGIRRFMNRFCPITCRIDGCR